MSEYTRVQHAEQSSGTSVALGVAPTPGDLLYAIVWNTSAVVNTAAGWVAIDTTSQSPPGFTAYRIAQSGDSLVQSPTTTAGSGIEVIEYYATGGWSSTPVDVHGTTHNGAATPPTVTSGSLTPTAVDDLVVVSGGCGSALDSPPTSLGSMNLVATFNTKDISFDQFAPGAGAFSQTLTWTGSTSSTANVLVTFFKPYPVDYATLTATLGALTGSLAGKVPVTGRLTATLGALVGNLAAKVGVSASLASTLGPASLSATAKAFVKGVVSETLGALTVESTGTVIVDASARVTLGGLLLDAWGGVFGVKVFPSIDIVAPFEAISTDNPTENGSPHANIVLGTVGVPINVTPGGYDLTETTTSFIAVAPNGTVSTFGMVPLQPDTDGITRMAQYFLTGSDFNAIGSWTCRMRAVWGDGKELFTTAFIINVETS
jgi:hypothetical protein